MIENTDAEKIERLNARVVELLRENGRLQEAKRRALLIADERAKEAADLRLQLVNEHAIEAGAKALADRIWHPPPKTLASLNTSEVRRLKDQARAVLQAAATLPDDHQSAPAPRPSREHVARMFAIVWHGDANEWEGFLSKADTFLGLFDAVTSAYQTTKGN